MIEHIVVDIEIRSLTMKVISHINDIIDVRPHFRYWKPPEIPKGRGRGYGYVLAMWKYLFELLEELEVVCAIRRQAKVGTLEVCGLGWLSKGNIIERETYPRILPVKLDAVQAIVFNKVQYVDDESVYICRI